MAFLFFGINWQSKPLGSLEVGLVGAPSAPVSAPPPPPEPPKVETPPPPPEPPPPEPPKQPPPKPEIATKEPEKKPVPPKPEKKPDPPKPEKKPEQPLKPIDTLKQNTQMLEQAIKRNEDAKRANEILEGGARQGAQAVGNPGELDAYRAAIAAKVRQNLVVPPDLSGRPKAVFEIEQIMGSRGGEVINVRLKQSSGHRTLDEAIERAVRKSDPLPPPDNPALFRRRLEITFDPFEEQK
jgi:colicin import membrane protein